MESGALTEMSSATTSQAAIGIEPDQEAEKVEQSLAARALRITGTLTTKRHIATHSSSQTSSEDMTRVLGKVSYGKSLVGFKSRLNDGWHCWEAGYVWRFQKS